jgi:hypothetical protein
MGILQRIHLGVMDKGLFYRPIHSAKARKERKGRRRRNSYILDVCRSPASLRSIAIFESNKAELSISSPEGRFP